MWSPRVFIFNPDRGIDAHLLLHAATVVNMLESICKFFHKQTARHWYCCSVSMQSLVSRHSHLTHPWVHGWCIFNIWRHFLLKTTQDEIVKKIIGKMIEAGISFRQPHHRFSDLYGRKMVENISTLTLNHRNMGPKRGNASSRKQNIYILSLKTSYRHMFL